MLVVNQPDRNIQTEKYNAMFKIHSDIVVIVCVVKVWLKVFYWFLGRHASKRLPIPLIAQIKLYKLIATVYTADHRPTLKLMFCYSIWSSKEANARFYASNLHHKQQSHTKTNSKILRFCRASLLLLLLLWAYLCSFWVSYWIYINEYYTNTFVVFFHYYWMFCS